MSAFRAAQSSFVMGEISKDASARIDLEEFGKSVRLMSNFLPIPSGGARKRPGTKFVREILDLPGDPEYGPALIPFEFLGENSYVIAIRNNGSLPLTGTPATHIVQIFLNDPGGSRIGVDTGIITFNYPHTIAASVNPAGYTYARAGDQMFITHESGLVPPIVITRLASASFTVTDLPNAVTSTLVAFDVEEAVRTPYRKNFTPTTLTPNGLVGTVTVVASDTIFQVAHIGAYIKITQGAKTGVARISAFNSSTSVDVEVIPNLGGIALAFFDTSASDNWHISEWNDVDGYPRAVAIYEERTVWGGSRTKKDVLFISLAGNLFHLMEERLEQDKGSSTDISGIRFFGDILSVDPFTRIVGNKDNNAVSWIDSSSNLEVGTLSGEYVVTEGDDGIFRGDTARVKFQASNGSKANKALRIADRLLFISRDGKKVRDFKFNARNSSHISNDMTVLNTQIHRHGTFDPLIDKNYVSDEFVDMAHQPSRETSWFLTSKHDLVGLTISTENQGVAWSRHIIAGVKTNIWGIAVTTNAESEFDDLYKVVERTISGARKFYLEKTGKDFDSDTLDNSVSAATFGVNSPLYETEQPLFLDSHLRFVAIAATNIITGLGHLEAETVMATVNGIKCGQTYVVAAGAITIDKAFAIGDVLCVGLFYEGEIQLHDPEAGGDKGDAEAAQKQIDRVDLDLVRTFNLKAGIVGSRFEESISFPTKDVEDGFHEAKLHASPSKSQNVFIKSTEPYPCTILSAVLRGKTYD